MAEGLGIFWVCKAPGTLTKYNKMAKIYGLGGDVVSGTGGGSIN